ncbi:MAG: tRNA uridine-5-carboxymethylaminomethyl(34) synthesis GTPase MnmE [Desulfuromonas sp.]|nr:MAG: tRNA uridine-5-carboxymethylaminomethyl(34) synthesis GTPase MnmE [Desulfuromonas sp.]
MYLLDDTIVAPLTPVGQGAVTILRISGPDSIALVNSFFKPVSTVETLKSHYFYYGHFYISEVAIDEIMLVIMKSPKSYTCEDVVEIHCHASIAIVTDILDDLLSKGVRMADPGEFTFRAFKNGRIDLSESEAVADLIASRSATASRLALRQLEGELSHRIFLIKDLVVNMLSLLEAYIDFPEEDISSDHYSSLLSNSQAVLSSIEVLLAGFDEGRLLRDGLSLLILGKPNVGKSSLLNALLGQDRAIVTDIPGTTRDIIQESITLRGFPVTVIDTAGIRQTDDPIERDGVTRAKQQIAKADIVLYMVDGAEEFDPAIFDDIELLESSHFCLVVNKMDKVGFEIPKQLNDYPVATVSVKYKEGLDSLIDCIFTQLNISGVDNSESVLVSDRRHRDALLRTRSFILEFYQSIQSVSVSDEFLAIHLRDALYSLGEITGETTTDDILNTIFNRFCIGK